ncbi:MAG: HAD-IA family hydrolase [Pseudomonadota bacterium]
MDYEAVIFDCDGVLVDSEALGLEDSAKYLRSHNLPYTPVDLIRIYTGLRDDVFARTLAAAYREANNEADPPEDFFQGLIDARRSRSHLLQPVSGALETLTGVTGRKAVASSSRAHYLESKLKRTGLWEAAAPHVYSAELVAHGKPAPDIFLYAAQKLGVAPEKCLVLEDAENGVKAGVAAGMTVWGFTGGGHCFEGHAERLKAAGAAWVAPNFPAFLAAL